MAIAKLIEVLGQSGISASVELPNRKWIHSDEYLAIHYGGTKRLVQVLRSKAEAGSEKARMQLQLVLNKLEVFNRLSEPEEEKVDE